MLLQEINQVVAQYLTEDSSWDALVPKIQDTCQRLVNASQPIPRTVYLDNTVAGESGIQAAVPGPVEVKEDHFHSMRRVTNEVPDECPYKSECQLPEQQRMQHTPHAPQQQLHTTLWGRLAV